MWRYLEAYADGDLSALVQIANSGQPESEKVQARDTLMQAIETAFSLEPFDPLTGGGCTEEYKIRLYDDYMKWIEDKKKDGDIS